MSIPGKLVSDVYSAIASRRTAFDTMMWQVPALGLTAQAFLLTIAYGPRSAELARYVAASLALVVALVAIQTMRKHRANELTDSVMLERIEMANHISIAGERPHARAIDRADAIGNKDFRKRSVREFQSFTLWLWGLRLFALAALLAIVITAIDPSRLRAEPEALPGISPARDHGR